MDVITQNKMCHYKPQTKQKHGIVGLFQTNTFQNTLEKKINK